MKATRWEFENRAVILGVVFGVSFFLSSFDRRNAAVAVAEPLAARLHVDGDDEATAFDALERASGRLGKLVAVSVLVGLGVGLGVLLLVIPGLVLATRWAVAVPVAMLKKETARGAMKRSRAIVAGNG